MNVGFDRFLTALIYVSIVLPVTLAIILLFNNIPRISNLFGKKKRLKRRKEQPLEEKYKFDTKSTEFILFILLTMGLFAFAADPIIEYLDIGNLYAIYFSIPLFSIFFYFRWYHKYSYKSEK